jgi:hypothetical protein
LAGEISQKYYLGAFKILKVVYKDWLYITNGPDGPLVKGFPHNPPATDCSVTREM